MKIMAASKKLESANNEAPLSAVASWLTAGRYGRGRDVRLQKQSIVWFVAAIAVSCGERL